MKKHLKFLAIAACALTFAACSNDDPEAPKTDPDAPTAAEGAFILNQGSYYSQIEGSLTVIDYNSNDAVQGVFQNANGRSLGATPQGAVAYGSKIYIGVYDSNLIEIIDRNTYKSLKTISLAQPEGSASYTEAQFPRHLLAKDGKVYISMFSGYVSRLDTLSLEIDKSVEVGPNPEVMAIKGNYLYVPNSGGLKWESGYNNTASKINLSTFTVEEEFQTSVNPTKFASNGTDLFLLCMGNYYDIPSAAYRVGADNKLEQVAECTLIDMKDNTLYYINAPYWATDFEYKAYDVATGTTADMLASEGVESPAGLAVDPINGNIIITSYNKENGYASYNTDGYANVYDADGKLLRRYDAGVGPVCIFFNNK